ncbi:coiled-coil domain-containing protein [Paenibacillus sp. FSL L8-0463]|uniref:coiled-coil domain-containing protein n=1 Tax=Paenibacillus sp. FSL L8-0463 TaxID=2954687 RepID=UPI00311928D2
MLSRNILSRRFAFLLILLLCTMLPLTSAASLSMGSSAAAVSSPPDFPDNEETRRLLEQTLSSAEIEREILRVTAEQKVLEKKVSLLSKQAAEKEAAIADQQERAGAVIRSYYMGDRDSLLAALLSAKSISRMLALYDYYEIIIGQDRDILNHYEEQYKDMKSTITASLRSSKELEELKTALTEQKTRVAALNEEIEGGISASSDPESMSALLNEFTRYWENIGIHEVKTYFKALSSAMNHLPQFVQSKSGMLTRKGMTYTLALKEEDLNTFLISQNELFKDFAFHFNKGQVTASGTSGGLKLTLTGHYTIENEPVNGLMFHVDNVVFNGLELPDSTRQSLEEEFDLGFYPEKIVSLLHATEVESKEGVLYVKLSISF